MTKNDIRKKVDILFENIREYRTSEYFMNLLDFCAKFKSLAPYNAMLVRFQMPGARYVLSSSEWRDKYHRAINADARPLVVLCPFGPVNFVFDIQETHAIPTQRFYSDAEILEELEKPYKTIGIVNQRYISNLIFNSSFHSIAFNSNLNAGSELGAKISLLKEPYQIIDIEIPNTLHPIKWKADYIIGTNNKGDDNQTFASIIHELGHLFCHHLDAPEEWGKAWKVRRINDDAREFEAETVSWLICDRVNLKNSPEKYLSYFVDGKIPDGVSIDAIFSAFNKIWDMCSTEYFLYQDGLLNKHSKQFQNAVTQAKEQFEAKYGRR